MGAVGVIGAGGGGDASGQLVWALGWALESTRGLRQLPVMRLNRPADSWWVNWAKTRTRERIVPHRIPG